MDSFLESRLSEEGEAWFSRNSSFLGGLGNRYDVHFIQERLAGKQIETILEVGASSGIGLETLCKAFGAKGFGIDPSRRAIASGTSRLQQSGSDVTLKIGFGHNLPFKEECFDLVILGFFLYLLPEPILTITLEEARRVVKREGFLVVTEFDIAGAEVEKPYTHQPSLMLHKRDYGRRVLALGEFSLIEKMSFSEGKEYFDSDPNSRFSSQVFFREKSSIE